MKELRLNKHLTHGVPGLAKMVINHWIAKQVLETAWGVAELKGDPKPLERNRENYNQIMSSKT